VTEILDVDLMRLKNPPVVWKMNLSSSSDGRREYSVGHLEKSWFQCLLAVNVEVISMKIYT